jgi:hypothetical protein
LNLDDIAPRRPDREHLKRGASRFSNPFQVLPRTAWEIGDGFCVAEISPRLAALITRQALRQKVAFRWE